MLPKKRLLYVGNQLQPHGQSPTTADTLPPDLQRMGYEVTAVSSKKNKLLRLLEMVSSAFKHRKTIDVVLIDTYSTLNFYYAVAVAFLCRKYKIPYIPILHGGNLPQRLERNSNLSRKLFKNAMVNVAPSNYLLSQFIEKGYKNLIHIPNTIPLENYPFKIRLKPQYKLLWVRSFANIYNPQMALEIMQLLQKQGHSLSLCMVGPEKDGSLEACKKLAKEKSLDVRFTGKLSKEEWISLSQDYDIFINTTNFDNTPVSVIEAMALGLPVVSTNVGGLPFLIENEKTGILVPPNNPQAMAEAISSLVANPGKSVTISKNARNKVEQFDWEVVKEEWRKVIEGEG